MGFMDKMRSAVGGVSEELMQNGTLARGEIVSVQMTGTAVSVGGMVGAESVVCNVTLNVIMDSTPPYPATFKQAIPELVLDQLSSPGAVVAVRVNPANHQQVAIDFSSQLPA